MISVVVPVKDGGSDLVRCLEAIGRQRMDEEVEIVVVDSGSSDGSVESAHRAGARVHEIPPESFDHGATRNLLASLAHGDVLVFTSQDATPERDDWLTTLVTALRSGERIAGAYGRQVAYQTAKPPERFFLDFLYGPEPRIQRIERGGDLRLETTLFSNVNSAIPRALLEEHPFAEDLVMGEDQEWSRRMLLEGFALVYEPRAVVRHSHAYTLSSAFRRFFDSGVAADRTFVSEDAGSRAALRQAAARYARDEIEWLWSTGQRRWIPYTSLYELTKYTGLQLGRRHRRLPARLARRLSASPGYWAGGP